MRTLEGKKCHAMLMNKAADILRRQGYQVVFQGSINDFRIDVIGIKGEEKVGVECQVRPSWKVIKKKAREYADKLSRFIVAIPKDVRIRVKPKYVEIWRLDVPKPRQTGKAHVRVDEKLWEEFVSYVVHKTGDAEKVRIELERVIRDFLEREGWLKKEYSVDDPNVIGFYSAYKEQEEMDRSDMNDKV